MNIETIDTFSFGRALEELRSGKNVTRVGWNGANQWIALQVPDDNGKMKRPYLFISPVDGKLVPWFASQTDLLSDDWFVVEA